MYHMKIPSDLFPLIAHAAKHILEKDFKDARVVFTRSYLDKKGYEGGQFMSYLMQIHDFIKINSKVKANITAQYDLDDRNFGLAVYVLNDIAQFDVIDLTDDLKKGGAVIGS